MKKEWKLIIFGMALGKVIVDKWKEIMNENDNETEDIEFEIIE